MAGFFQNLLTETATVQDLNSQVDSATTTSTNTIKIQQPTIGFGSYLSGILPPDIATACGALSQSFLQVKNITDVPVEKFGQVVTNLETIVGLPVNGTNVPTDLQLRTQGRPLIALGSGPQGTYTVSDFFGCMSGLPYNGPLKNILARLQEVATRKLFNIYHETYLAVTWQRAKCTISQNVYFVNVQPYIAPDPSALPPIAGQPRIDDWYYTVSFSLGVTGGGYSRGTAVAPLVDFFPNHCGASMTVTEDSNDNNIPGTFGRVATKSMNKGSPYLYTTTSVMQAGPPSQPTPPEEWIRIEAPPIEMLPVQDNGEKSTAGVNVVGYASSSFGNHTEGTWFWPRGGSSPGMNTPIQGYIDQANQEIDYINTTKRASCQSLNDSWNATGTQLTIEQRARQTGLKPPLSDPRENYMSLFPTVVYNFVDATAQYAKNTEPHMYAQTIENISDLQTAGGQSAVASMRQQRNQDRLNLLGIPLDNNINDKLPYDQQKILIANGTLPTGRSDTNIPSGSTISTSADPIVVTPPATPGQIDPDGNTITAAPIGTVDPITGLYYPTSPEYGGQVPPIPLDNGNAFIPASPPIGTPGSFAGSPYTNLIPPELNAWYTSNTLYPSTYTVSQAIEEVVRCNCDCWQLA